MGNSWNSMRKTWIPWGIYGMQWNIHGNVMENHGNHHMQHPCMEFHGKSMGSTVELRIPHEFS